MLLFFVTFLSVQFNRFYPAPPQFRNSAKNWDLKENKLHSQGTHNLRRKNVTQCSLLIKDCEYNRRIKHSWTYQITVVHLRVMSQSTSTQLQLKKKKTTTATKRIQHRGLSDVGKGSLGGQGKASERRHFLNWIFKDKWDVYLVLISLLIMIIALNGHITKCVC